MTIQQIECILEVQRAGSISKAAERLHMAQPNVSNAISAVESETGINIFIRSNRGVLCYI